jgi:isopentenyl diphosphate isomerase/L-lactate dehydrogenase-like FMN-dependent dehydrogenase
MVNRLRISKLVVMTYLKVLSWHVPEEIKENYQKPLSVAGILAEI